jgi:hypothetical protein
MRTVTSICLAAVGGITLAFFLLALFVAPVGWLIPGVALVLSLLLFWGALAMARQAGTPGCLPLAIFVLMTLVWFLLLWSSW